MTTKKTTIVDINPSEVEIQLALGVMSSYNRAVLARHTSSLEVFELLLHDKDYVVRVHLALNRHTPVYMLNTLCYDESQLVRDSAAENLLTKPNDEKRNSNSAGPRYTE